MSTQTEMFDLFEAVDSIQDDQNENRGPARFFTLRPGQTTTFTTPDGRNVEIPVNDLKFTRNRANVSAKNDLEQDITNVHLRYFFDGNLIVDGVEHPWFANLHAWNEYVDLCVFEQNATRIAKGLKPLDGTNKRNAVIDLQLWQTGVNEAEEIIHMTGAVHKALTYSDGVIVPKWEQKNPGNFMYWWGPPAGDPNDRSHFGIPVQELQFRANWSQGFEDGRFKSFIEDLDAAYKRQQDVMKLQLEVKKLQDKNPEAGAEKAKDLNKKLVEIRNGVDHSMLGANSKGFTNEGQIQSMTVGGKKFNFWSNSDPATFNLRKKIAAQKITKPAALVSLEQAMAAADPNNMGDAPLVDEPSF